VSSLVPGNSKGVATTAVFPLVHCYCWCQGTSLFTNPKPPEY